MIQPCRGLQRGAQYIGYIAPNAAEVGSIGRGLFAASYAGMNSVQRGFFSTSAKNNLWIAGWLDLWAQDHLDVNVSRYISCDRYVVCTI